MRRIVGAVLAATLALTVPTMALAEHLYGNTEWKVTYTTDGKMTDNYSQAEYVDDVRGLEPGDDITFVVKLNHENANAADWYMANDVIESLEDADDDAAGSSYEYLLTYTGPTSSSGQSTSRTLYDSSSVGGDDTEGLNEATSSLEEFFYLDNLSKGQTAQVTLKVTLDGETEQNAYFDTLGKLKMRFAVEPDTKSTTPENPTNPKTVVQTGDETRLFPFYVAMVVSGLGLLLLGFWSLRLRKQDRKEGAR